MLVTPLYICFNKDGPGRLLHDLDKVLLSPSTPWLLSHLRSINADKPGAILLAVQTERYCIAVMHLVNVSL